MQRARELAAQLMENSPASLRATKKLLTDHARAELDAQIDAAVRENAAIRTTADFREGISSFLEKRKPVWSGEVNSNHPRCTSVNETRLRVRYAETDQMGVVYHSNHFIWFEVGRVELLRQLGFSYRDMESEDGRFIAVAEAKCRYRAPVRYDEEIVVRTEMLNVRDSVVHFGYELRRARRRRAAGGRRDHAHRHGCGDENRGVAGKIFKSISRSGGETETGKLYLNALHINGNDLTLEAVREVATERRPVLLSADAREAVDRARAVVDEIVASNKLAYAITTGVGKLSDVRIAGDQIRELQVNLVRSHAVGVGEPLSIGGNSRHDAFARQFAGQRLLRACAPSSSIRSAKC